MNMDLPVWITEIQKAIRKNWHPLGLTDALNWLIEKDGQSWSIQMAPVYQEVVGGEQDGEVVWSPFVLDLGDLLQDLAPVFRVVGIAAACPHKQYATAPMLLIDGRLDDTQVAIAIRLEPPTEASATEVLDVIRRKVYPKHTFQRE
jgi:hypothetical protein